MIAERNEGLLQRAPWTFLPADGLTFFENRGWSTNYVESIVDGAARFDRLAPEMKAMVDSYDGPPPDPRNPGDAPYSAVVDLTPNR